MIGTDFKWLQMVFVYGGALSVVFDKNTGKFEPKTGFLLYSCLIVLLYEVLAILNHKNVVFSKLSDSFTFRKLLHKCDTLVWIGTMFSFLVNNIHRHKNSAKILNKISDADQKFGIHFSSYQVDLKLQRIFQSIFKVFICYFLVAIFINTFETKTDELFASPVPLKIIYVAGSLFAYLPRCLFETFLLLKMRLTFAGMKDNIKTLKYKEHIYEVFNAFEEYCKIMNLIERQFTLAMLTQLLTTFLLLSLVMFYNFEYIAKKSNDSDQTLSLMAGLVWNLLFVPFFLNCSLCGKIQVEVGGSFSLFLVVCFMSSV